jgi:hypothetical protein
MVEFEGETGNTGNNKRKWHRNCFINCSNNYLIANFLGTQMKKTMQAVLGAAVLLCASTASATVWNFQYKYDGVALTTTNGSAEMFGTNLAVGDTVNLTYIATGAASYWDFTGLGGSVGNVNLGFAYPSSCGNRSGHGDFTVSLDGSTVLAQNFAPGGQSCIHLGPNYADFSTVNHVDQFAISYTLDSSDAGMNTIGSYDSHTWWQVWELFNGNVAPFHFEADTGNNVPEPASIALLGLGLAGLGFMRRKAKN